MTDTPASADSFQALWQSMPTTPVRVSPEEMRGLALRFQRRVRRRNIVEYAAAAVVTAVFVWYATLPSTTLLWPAANIMIAVAAVWVGWTLHRKASASAAPAAGATTSLLGFHREALARQRDALKTVWRWYLLPFAPGLVLWFAAIWIGKGSQAPRPEVFAMTLGLVFALCVLVFLAVFLLNLLGAARLQRMIDDLDRYKEQP